MKPDRLFFNGVPLKPGARHHIDAFSFFFLFRPTSLSLTLSLFVLFSFLLHPAPHTIYPSSLNPNKHDAHIGANTLNKQFFPDAVLEAHGRTRIGLGPIGRRT